MTKGDYVYILASDRNGTLYIGVTSNLIERMDQHKTHAVPGFSAKYNTNKLVWCERCDTIEQAITREKQLKKWNRAWKIKLIEESNPGWNDLSGRII
jgi:putative endonuclease